MRGISCLALMAILLPVTGMAGEEKNIESWTIVPTHNRILRSEILGRNIRLQIGLPEKYEADDNKYGVIYCLDGFTFGGTLRETVYFLQWNEEIPSAITVSLDLEVNTKHEWYEHRSYILTPTTSDIYEKDFGVLESWTGGGPEFLKSLAEEIIPFVEGEYRTKVSDRTLVGHSFGGLFALYALFESPQLFSKYLISSPSLPWDDRVIFKLESSYAKTNSALAAKVFLSVGSQENLPDDMMVHHLKELAEILRLRKYAGLELTSIVFEGESHASVTPSAFSRGLRVLCSSEFDNSGEGEDEK